MRDLLDRERLHRVIGELGRRADRSCRVYLTGGATAVDLGWRNSTVDIDLKIEPDEGSLARSLPSLKNQLQVNIELASPGDFVPELPGWRERSVFIAQHGSATFLHYDPYAQALAKLERGHAKDLDDVTALGRRGLVDADELWRLFQLIEVEMYRFPSIDLPTFRAAVERFVSQARERP